MADDSHDPTSRPDDAHRGGVEDTKGAPSPHGLGRFASRFRRGQDTPPEAATDAPDADITLDPHADVPVLLNRPDIDWSVVASPRATDRDTLRTLDPEEPAEPSMSAAAATADDSPAIAAAAAPPEVPVSSPALEPSRATAPVARAEAAEAAEAAEGALADVAPDGPRTRPAGISAHLAVLTVVATAVTLAFLLIEPSPRWLLLLGAAAVVFGLDGTLRQTWRAPFSLGQETAPFLFAPALYMLAVPVLIEHNVSGELALLVGLGAGLGFGGLAWAEVASVRPQAPEYEQARIVVTANTYLAGFAIFSLSYVFEIGLPAAIIATAIAASMLAVEILREGEIDPMETLGLSLVAGIVIGEFRWLLYYVPLDTYLAGLTLLLAFYLTTGLLHSHVIRALNRVIALEYGGIAAAGLALVVAARAIGLA